MVGIVGVHNRDLALLERRGSIVELCQHLEQARFIAAILLDRAVKIEMLLRDIRQHRNIERASGESIQRAESACDVASMTA